MVYDDLASYNFIRDLTRQILSRNGSEAELLLLGRSFRFHFGEEDVEAGIGVKGLEVAVGLSIFEVEIAGVDGVPKKFEGLVAMPSESSATGEVIVRATEAGLARLLANGLNAIGIDFASFGVFAFDEKSGREAGQGLERFRDDRGQGRGAWLLRWSAEVFRLRQVCHPVEECCRDCRR